MFTELLADIQSVLPVVLNQNDNTRSDADTSEWESRIDNYVNQLSSGILYLQNSAHTTLGCRAFKKSKSDFYHNHSEIEFINARIRDDRVKGIQISLSLFKPFLNGALLEGPSMSTSLNITGFTETTAFKSLYVNYRRIIEILINRGKLHLVYYVPNYEPEVYFGKQIITRLDSHFSEGDFHGKVLSFSRLFRAGFHDNNVLEGFLVLAAMYDSSINYVSRPKRTDRILSYFHKLNIPQA